MESNTHHYPIDYATDPSIVTVPTPGGYKKIYDMNDHKGFTDPYGNLVSKKSAYTIAQVLSDLYVTYRGRYIRSQATPNGKCSIWCPHKGGAPTRLTQRVLVGHIGRKYAVHVYAGDESAVFMCFDVDKGDWSLVTRLIDAIEEYGIPRNLIYPSTSGGKGYHVEVFFDGPVLLTHLRDMYDWCMHRLKQDGIDTRKIECRPTHVKSIKLPLSVHHATGNICWFLDRESGEPYDYTDYIFEIQQMHRPDFIDLHNNHVSAMGAIESSVQDDKPRKNPKFHAAHFKTMPPWAPVVTAKGQRHNAAMRLAIMCKVRRIDYDSCMELQKMWLDAQNPAYIGTRTEQAMKDAEWICDWVYQDEVQFEEPESVRKRREAWEAQREEYINQKRKERGEAPPWRPTITADIVDPDAEGGNISEEAMRAQRVNPAYRVTAEDFSHVFAQKVGLTRVLYFMIMVQQAGTDIMGRGISKWTMETMAASTGFSVTAVNKAIQRMSDAGIIKKHTGVNYRSANGYPLKKPNHYFVNAAKDPVAACVEHATGEIWVGKLCEVQDDVWRQYFGAMMTVLDRDYAYSMLGKYERDMLNKISEEGAA